MLTFPVKASNATVPYLDSVPVMNGFTVMHDDILVFDKPEGQIIEVSLYCENNCPKDAEIYNYYRTVFINLGWQADDVMGFYKSNTAITMELQKSTENADIVIVTFQSST